MKQEHKVSKGLVDRMIEINFPFSGVPYKVQVMELLDEMPREIKRSGLEISLYNKIPLYPHNKQQKGYIRYYNYYKMESLHYIDMNFDEIPNALAEMVLWLHQNNYISFTK